MDRIAALELDRGTVLDKWYRSIAATYPKVTATFLVHERDRFRNPVGSAIKQTIGPLYDQVVSEMDEDAVRGALDALVRLRAIQDLAPSQAVGFVFGLKAVIRDAARSPAAETLDELDARIDRVALLAFDCYSACREQMHRIRGDELRARTLRLLERAGGGAVALGHERLDSEEDT